MNDKRTSLEVIAPTVEEAVAKGLGDLGLSEQDVEVEVLDTGSRGLFGLGYRQARVRLTIKAGPQDEQAVFTAPPPSDELLPVKPAAARTPVVMASATEPEETLEPETEEVIDDADLSEEQAATLKVARETVEDLLSKMKVKANVTAHYGKPEDAQDRAPLMVDVHGDDLAILIGPKAETLNALQYIASLIVGKEVGHALPLIVDVEGYRARRSQQVKQLAQRMAEQAIRTGKRQVLEPMPAGERRLIHIALRNNPKVTTESIGEEPRRKVTIIPK